ncbi:MAG: cytochrome ubiquinol oxidase subunit I [Cyanobacteria bacterium SZAS LIN-3]|nr:cytochrome ubiquinol oxidase subunit I [Cyanobacteria bacterium SZAS LIN-3]
MENAIELLARVQFAFTIMFHYLFPPLSIGLGTIIVVMEGLYLKTKRPFYKDMCKFWVKLFALNFSMGVATGVVMQAEFGTNWATYSRFVGDIFGSALAAEGIFAFFLESGFLAILLFGWDRVSPRVHFFATLMVCTGATFSAFWITVANSWMHTPAGFEIIQTALGPRAVINDFWAMVFNPSAMWRFAHVVVGSWIVGAFFVMSISAYYLIKKRHVEFARKSFTIALFLAMLATPLQGLIGSKQAEIMVEYNPSKMAAMEGNFKTTDHAPFWIIGIPDEKSGEIKYGIKVPGLLSYLATGSADGIVVGLDSIPPQDRPPVAGPFLCYHGMIGLGIYMMALSWLGGLMLWRKKLFESKWLLRIFVISVAAPYLANQLGWVASEVGRQPWIVYGLLRTSEALSKAVHAGAIVSSLIMFIVIYALLFLVFIYSLDRKIKRGPELHDDKSSKPDDREKGKRWWSKFFDGLRESDRKRLDCSRHRELSDDDEGGPK